MTRRRAEGFTLLELMVAMAVLALLAATLAGGLRFGLRAWEAGQRGADRVEAAAAVQALLRRQIEQAYPMLARSGEPAILFEGERERLRFLTLLPSRLGVPGLADVVLTYQPASRPDGRSDAREGGRLVMAWQPLGEHERPAEQRSLLEGIDLLRFAYYGGATRTGPPQWQDSWRDAGFLPTLVRLEIRFRDGRVWPDLVVAPAVTVDSLLD